LELWLYLNLSLVDVDLRSLETTGGQVYIHRNIAVTSVQLFALEEVSGAPATGFTFTAQLALPSCFEALLIETYPEIEITAGNGPTCDDCAFDCGGLTANCADAG
jgi:hypothetical protein